MRIDFSSLQWELLLKLRSLCPLSRAHSPRGRMACADVDMNIHGAAEEPGGADHGEAPNIWRYQAVEMIPDKRGPLHDLLQKQPAAFGVRTSDTLSTSSCCPPLPQSQNLQRWKYQHMCSDLSACVVCLMVSTKIKKPQSSQLFNSPRLWHCSDKTVESKSCKKKKKNFKCVCPAARGSVVERGFCGVLLSWCRNKNFSTWLISTCNHLLIAF